MKSGMSATLQFQTMRRRLQTPHSFLLLTSREEGDRDDIGATGHAPKAANKELTSLTSTQPRACSAI